MANPQIENGHTDIANEILDNLMKIRIPGEARQILDCILRKTYGWHKKSDKISISQFYEATKIKKPNIIRAIKLLLSMNLVIKKDNGIIEKDNDIPEYRFNKDFETWKPLSKKIMLSKKIIRVIEKDNLALSKKIPTKETITKETITKDNSMSQNNSKFVKPTIEEIKNYFFELGDGKYNHEVCETEAKIFFDHYETNGWVVGKTKMKKWRSAVSGWNTRDYDKRLRPYQRNQNSQKITSMHVSNNFDETEKWIKDKEAEEEAAKFKEIKSGM